MTPEEELIQRYFDAFDRHDIERVMACFHEDMRGSRSSQKTVFTCLYMR